MTQSDIRQLIESRLTQDGLVETGIEGVRLFRVTAPMRCAPAVYEPCVVAIVSGAKEAILDGRHFVYDSRQYLCCPTTLPVEAGTPQASPDNPLLGIYISLNTRVMKELALSLETVNHHCPQPESEASQPGLSLAEWDNTFTQALFRLLDLANDPIALTLLGDGRLRELYYAVLTGSAGPVLRQACSVSNRIARVIESVSQHLDQPITIEAMAEQARMSRAAFHRKFRQATGLAPMQFVKAVRLNAAAMRIAEGTPVSQAAAESGYVSSSQFSREFKRMFGDSPKRWQQTVRLPGNAVSAIR
ncbi:MAG: AraC family transcriptional regulator [Gammaproteobacteria bacterium]|nr:MAG: AraC family transcriptional regulator [Gammaproteobacteria bacterium]